MSLKPLKKSDFGKDWVRNDRYVRKIEIQPEYHLIVTEGTDTEPNYFEAIKKIINGKYSDRIVLKVEGKGDNTLGLFEKARESAAGPNDYKHVWIVYDTDDFPADHINRTAELCRNTEGDATQFHAIWSNQCIELWFLLHFGFYHSDIHRSEYWPKLTELLTSIGAGGYKKNRSDMYNILRPYLDAAIENAKKLDKMNEGKTPSASAPGTDKDFRFYQVEAEEIAQKIRKNSKQASVENAVRESISLRMELEKVDEPFDEEACKKYSGWILAAIKKQK